MASSSTNSSNSQRSSDLLREARFSPARDPDDIVAPTSSQLLNDAAAFHPLANLNSGELDYLLLDDGKLNDVSGGQTVLPSRGWGDELCYGTGTTYLAGLGTGGLWGLREGLARSRKIMTANPTLNNIAQQANAAATTATAATLGNAAPAGVQAAEAAAKASIPPTSSSTKPGPAAAAQNAFKSPSFRLRLNTVLNSITRRGSFVGNNAGVLAMLYNGFNSGLDKYRGLHDIYGSMLAGACTGLIWKSTAGIRPMMIASAGMTVGAAAWTTAKKALV